MSPTSLLESSPKATEHELNPKLKAVLGSLDVGIEEELTRYRRHRRRDRSQGQVSPQVQMGGNKPKQNLELVGGGQTQEEKTEEQKSELPEIQKLEQSQSGSTSERSPIFINTSEAGPLTIGRNDLEIEREETEKPTSSTDNPKGLNDYLESSEQLLKSLDRPTQPKPKQRGMAASLFTPVGIASMLLFMISCTALGSALIYAKNHNFMGLADLLKQEGASGEGENSEQMETASAGVSREEELPESPLTRSQDFVELNLATLGSINPSPSSIPSLSLSPSIPPPISGTIRLPGGSNPGAKVGGLNNLGTTLLPSQQSPGSQPQLNVPPQSPQPAPKPSTPAALKTPVQSSDGWFYVVKEYAGENSLTQAREIVPDAYIRQTTDGPKIQMGALLDSESAKRLLKELEEQGVSAQFYKF